MNSLQLRTTLYSATASTFEELALLCPSPDVGREQRLERIAGGASVNFDGPIRGALVLAVTGDILTAAATNMLARDEAPAAGLQHDAVCELANVICGSLLPQVAGRRAIFRLAPPSWHHEGGAVAAAMTTLGSPIAEILMGLDEGRVEVSLFIANARVGLEGAAP